MLRVHACTLVGVVYDPKFIGHSVVKVLTFQSRAEDTGREIAPCSLMHGMPNMHVACVCVYIEIYMNR